MSIQTDDIRAAVSAGILSEDQAVSLNRIADEREGYRQSRSIDDEPFELFKGFNEVFIVVGLVILFAGWNAITLFTSHGPNIVSSLILLAATIGLTSYFTKKRRMVAPSILLSLFVGAAGGMIGTSLAPNAIEVTVSAGICCLILAAYWYYFRIPFSLFLIGLSAFLFVAGLVTKDFGSDRSLEHLFIMTSDSQLSLLTLGMGLIALIFALRFDLSDPHRVTRRSANGFWLHVLAAPTIVNAIGLSLFNSAGPIAMLLLVLFLILISLFAIIVDRRSFLMSGIGYMIAIISYVADGGYGLIILLVGIGLVFLGATWEKLRCKLLNAIPDFKNKDKLPPWNRTPKDALND